MLLIARLVYVGYVAGLLPPLPAPHIAGFYEGQGCLGLNSRGNGLKLTFQRACGEGLPLCLEQIAQVYQGKVLKVKTGAKQRSLYRLMYTAAPVQRLMLTDMLPYLQMKRQQAEAALEFLALDGRIAKEAKIAAGERVIQLNPRNAALTLSDVEVDHGRINSAYAAGLVRAVGSLAFHDGGIRLTFGSKSLARLMSEVWQSSPDYRGEVVRPLNKKGEFSLSSTDCYMFLMWIKNEMPADCPRSEQCDILVKIFEEFNAPRWAGLTPDELSKRAALVNRLGELKRI